MVGLNDEMYLIFKKEDFKYLNKRKLKQLNDIISIITNGRIGDGKNIDNKYFVVNQNELYADKILKIILHGERLKTINDNIEPRFQLDKNNFCYGCHFYKHISDTSCPSKFTLSEIDENGGVCDISIPCNNGSKNDFRELFLQLLSNKRNNL